MPDPAKKMADVPRDQQASYGLSDLLVWVRRHSLLIGTPIVVCLILGIIYAVAATPKYRVSALLAPQETSDTNQLMSQLGSQLGALGLGAVVGRDRGNRADVSVAILTSRKFVGDFIEHRELLPVLYASRWDDEAGDWAESNDPPPSVNDGYRKFMRNVLSVNRDELTGFVTVIVEWKDSQVAHDWLVALIDDLNESVRQREREEALRSLQFLREELGRTEIVDLRQALHQLSLVELQRLTLANVREEFAFNIIDPPTVPDADDPVWPKSSLIVLSSIFIGLFLGVLLAITVTTIRALPRSS